MLEKIKKYKLTAGLFAASAVLILIGFVRAICLVLGTSGPFIVHFSDMQGIMLSGGAGIIVFAGIFGMVVVALNGSVALELEGRNVFFGRLVAVVTLVFAILLFIAFTAILSVN